MKAAADTVPVVAGRVTPPPPPVVRVPAGASTTVPESVADTATLPKFISAVLAIEIGVMMLAEHDAVAVACANELLAKPANTTVAAMALMMFFIVLRFCLFEFVVLFVFVVCLFCKLYCQCCARIANALKFN